MSISSIGGIGNIGSIQGLSVGSILSDLRQLLQIGSLDGLLSPKSSGATDGKTSTGQGGSISKSEFSKMMLNLIKTTNSGKNSNMPSWADRLANCPVLFGLLDKNGNGELDGQEADSMRTLISLFGSNPITPGAALDNQGSGANLSLSS